MARIGIITDIHNNAAALKLILRELEKEIVMRLYVAATLSE